MMKFLMVMFGLVMLASCAACSTQAPDAGHEIVLVEKPLVFGHGGIDPSPVRVGRQWTWWTTDGVDVNMQPQKYDVQMDDTMTSDGVPIDFHAVMVLKVEDSVTLVTRFGPEWYKNNLDQPFQTSIRQAVRKHGMNETAINTNALDTIDAEVHDKMVKFIKEKDLPVQLVTLTVGKANPPDSVADQRIATAREQQRIQTEGQRKLAEDGRAAAETARAKADNAYREAMGMSSAQFIQLETVKMQREACGKDGKATCTFIEGSGVQPVYPVR